MLGVFISADPAPALLAPIPSFTFPEAAAVALSHAANYAEWRRQPEGVVASFDDIDRAVIRLGDRGDARARRRLDDAR